MAGMSNIISGAILLVIVIGIYVAVTYMRNKKHNMLNIINYIMAYTKLWCKKRRQNTMPPTKYRHHNFCLLYYNKLPAAIFASPLMMIS